MEYIQDVAGCRTVPVEVGSRYTDEEWSQTLMTVNEFISKYIRDEVCPHTSFPVGLTAGRMCDIRALQGSFLEASVSQSLWSEGGWARARGAGCRAGTTRLISSLLFYLILGSTIWWFFSVFVRFCRHHQCLIPEHSHHSQRNPVAMNSHFPFGPPTPSSDGH